MPYSPEVLAYLAAIDAQRPSDNPERRHSPVEHPANFLPMSRGYAKDISYDRAHAIISDWMRNAVKSPTLWRDRDELEFVHPEATERWGKVRDKVRADGLIEEYLKDIK